MQIINTDCISQRHELKGTIPIHFRTHAFIIQEFTRAFGGWFAIAVLISIGAMLLTETGTILSVFTLKSSSSSLLMESMEKSALFIVSPIIVALPYATSYIIDFKSRYLRYLLPRCGWKRFTIWRFVANALSGSMCVFIAQLLLVVFSIIAYPYEDVPYRYVNVMNRFEQLEYSNVMNYILLIMIMQLPCHVARASTALMITPWINNPFAALIAPLIFDNTLSMLSNSSRSIAWLRERCILPLELVYWGNDVVDVMWYLIIAILRTILCYTIFRFEVKHNAYK